MTTPLHDNAADAWRTLEIGGGTDEFSLATVRLALDAGYGPVRVARGPAGDLQLLIPTDSGRRIVEGVSSEAVPVRSVQFLVGGRPQPFIELSCADSELHAPFLLLVDDVIRRLYLGTGPEQSVAAAVSQFRDLLRRGPAYSLEALIGVFGELRLLNEMLPLNSGAAANWTGPLRQRHDFSSPLMSAEVKSTLKREGKTVRITSLEQLQLPSDGRPLVLVHTVLERTGTGGTTVRDLIAEAARLAADPSVIDRALQSLQMDDWRSNPLLVAERFALLRVDIFRIDAAFPRLDPGSFRPGFPPAGILGVEYSLDLEHARAWQLAPPDAPGIIRRLAGIT